MMRDMKFVTSDVEMYPPCDGTSFLLRGARAPKILVRCSEPTTINFMLPCPDELSIRAIRVLTKEPLVADQLLEVLLAVGSHADVLAMDRLTNPVFIPLRTPFTLTYSTFAQLQFQLVGPHHGSVEITPSIIGTLKQPSWEDIPR